MPVHVLKITALREEKPLFASLIHSGDKIALGNIHSVELCPVWDYFAIDNEFRIVLHETAFLSSNTGLPCIAAGEEVFYSDGDKFRITNMHRVVSAITLWVHKKYDNTLKINETSIIKLFTLQGNTLLKIAVEKINIATFSYLQAKIFMQRKLLK